MNWKATLTIGAILLMAPSGQAAEWVKVTENSVNDRFFVDKSTIQRRGDTAWFWEYREFPQPNNAFLAERVDRPVHGVVMNWSANCSSRVQRLRQVTAYDKTRKVIRKFNYGESGNLLQPRSRSSADAVLNYVCAAKESETPAKPES